MQRHLWKIIAIIAVICALLAGCGTQTDSAPMPLTRELALGVGKDCPAETIAVLEDFCSRLYQLSGGTLRAALHYWDAPLDSDSHLLFLTGTELSKANESLKGLTGDFLFSSYSHLDDALNAQSLRDSINKELTKSANYTVEYALYMGRQYLLCSESNAYYPDLQNEDATGAEELVTDIVDFKVVSFYPLDFSRPFEKNAFYFTSSADLAGYLKENAPDTGWALLELPYRYHFGYILFSNDLPGMLSNFEAACLSEACSYTAPESAEVFLEMERICEKEIETVLPVDRFERAIRAKIRAQYPQRMADPFLKAVLTFE